MAPTDETEKNTDFTGGKENVLLHLIGENTFNNEIMAGYLSERTGIASRHHTCSGIEKEFSRHAEMINLVLFDSDCLKDLSVESSAELKRIARATNCLVIFFHVEPERHIELEALRNGVRGILYKNQPMSFFPIALRAVLAGELFYPRSILEKYFLNKNLAPVTANKEWHTLTARQKEILSMLMEGKNNQDIATQFCISPHTVKTHIYNIYKKLKVSSRLQASKKIAD